MTRVTMQHCRDLRYCVTGVRRFCADNNLDFKQLISPGIPIEELPANDSMVQALIEHAEKENVGRE